MFQTLLKNHRYLGEHQYKRVVIPDAIPTIITQEIKKVENVAL